MPPMVEALMVPDRFAESNTDVYTWVADCLLYIKYVVNRKLYPKVWRVLYSHRRKVAHLAM